MILLLLDWKSGFREAGFRRFRASRRRFPNAGYGRPCRLDSVSGSPSFGPPRHFRFRASRLFGLCRPAGLPSPSSGRSAIQPNPAPTKASRVPKRTKMKQLDKWLYLFDLCERALSGEKRDKLHSCGRSNITLRKCMNFGGQKRRAEQKKTGRVNASQKPMTICPYLANARDGRHGRPP
jgi:hypothetical protein